MIKIETSGNNCIEHDDYTSYYKESFNYEIDDELVTAYDLISIFAKVMGDLTFSKDVIIKCMNQWLEENHIDEKSK